MEKERKLMTQEERDEYRNQLNNISDAVKEIKKLPLTEYRKTYVHKIAFAERQLYINSWKDPLCKIVDE